MRGTARVVVLAFTVLVLALVLALHAPLGALSSQSARETSDGTLPPDVHPDSRNRLPPIKAGVQGLAAIRLHASGASVRWASPLGRSLTELAILTTAREHDQPYEWSLHEMEGSGGEPDVVGFDKKTGEYIFYDCSAESPKGRRSFCYDREALEARKENKPENCVMDMAAAMGIELLTEEQYRELQRLGNFDAKTSSWVKTPSDIRKLGGALYCDRRYGRVFVGHNGAQSYYNARAFRGSLKV